MTASGQRTPQSNRRLGWDAVLITIAAALLLQIWRLQDLFPVLRVVGLPIAATLLPLGLLAVDTDPRRTLRPHGSPILRVALAILVLVVLSIPGSIYPGAGAEFLIKDYWRSVAGMALIAGSVRALSDVERFTWLQVVGATLFCGVVLLRFTPTESGRLGELEYYDSNDLALVIVCTLPLAAYLLRRLRGLGQRLVVLGAITCLLATLVKTGSRGGFLGLIAAAAYMVFFLGAVPVRTRLGVVAVLGILLVGFSTDRYWDMMQTILHPTKDYNWAGNAEAGRMELWMRGIGYIAAHPLLGVGASAYSSAEGTLAPGASLQDHGIGWKWSEAHNSFIQIGAELGVLGLVLFVALLVSAFRVLARVGRGPPGNAAFLAQSLAASLVAFCVSGFFLSAAYGAYLYALLGMVVGLGRVGVSAPVVVAPAIRRSQERGGLARI